MSRLKRLSVLGSALLGASIISGCSLMSPQTTNLPYDPSDGVGKDLGNGVLLRNALVIAEAPNKPGTLLASVVNTSDKSAKVFVTGEGVKSTVEVPARSTVKVSPRTTTSITVPSVSSGPGLFLPLLITTSDMPELDPTTGQMAQRPLNVPVLDGTLPEYRPYLPAAGAATSSATGSPTGTATSSTGTATVKPSPTGTHTGHP